MLVAALICSAALSRQQQSPGLVVATAAPNVGQPWTSFGENTIWINSQCKDLLNLVKETNVTCQSKCLQQAGCTAINAVDHGGPCALRACTCGGRLTPGGKLNSFRAYILTECNDGPAPPPPPPPPPGFAHVFGSNMVLQRAPLQARVFGYAAPNSAMTVTLAPAAVGASASAPQSHSVQQVRADGSGRWQCSLPATPSSSGMPYTVSLTDASTGAVFQVLDGVLFGDVVVCSGQSNMVETVQLVNNASAEIAAAASFHWIRLAVVATDHSSVPLNDTAGPLLLPWQAPSPAAFPANSWNTFSATCWFTARDLARKLGPSVPLGLIDSAVGGTPIERWMPKGAGDLYNAMVAPLTGL